MDKVYSIYFFLISSVVFSQEIVNTSKFSAFNFHSKEKPFQPNQTILNNPFSMKRDALSQNEYPLEVPKIQVEKPITFYTQDNFTGKYTLYSVSNNNFKVVQTYSNFYEFESVCTLEYSNRALTIDDLYGHVLSTYISQFKFKLKEGCK